MFQNTTERVWYAQFVHYSSVAVIFAVN